MSHVPGKQSAVSQYSVSDARARLSDLINKALRGEEVVIARDNKPLVRLVPLAGAIRRTPGSAKGQVRMAKDFDRTPRDFEEYL